MVDKTPVTAERPAGSPVDTMSRNLGDFAADLISLAELQWELLKVDVRDSVRGGLIPVFLAVACLPLLLAALPVFLAGISLLLIRRGGLSDDVAFLLTAGGVIFIVAAVVTVAVTRLREPWIKLSRSRQELHQNVLWIKNALKQTSARRDLENPRSSAPFPRS